MIFNSSGIKQYKSQLWDFDFQSSIWNKNQMDENHTDQVSLTIGLKTWKKKEKKNPLSQSSLYGPGNKVARLWRHVRCLIPAFGQMDFRVPSSELRAPSSDFRVPISVFGNQKIPAINFWFMKFRKRIGRKASWLSWTEIETNGFSKP